MMKHNLPLILCVLLSINLSACNSVGNVVPQKGLSMEQAYDDMGHRNTLENPLKKIPLTPSTSQAIINENDGGNVDMNPYEVSLNKLRSQVNLTSTTQTNLHANISENSTWPSFHKVPNPSLHLYVYPHLAGSDELPIPGYTTAFNAYEKDHYALSVRRFNQLKFHSKIFNH